MKARIRNQRGIVLMITLMFTLISAIGVAAFLHLMKTQVVQVRLQSHSTKAFYAAEVGLGKAMELLKNDFYYTPKPARPSWADGAIYTAADCIDLTPRGYPRYLDLENPDYDNDFYSLVAETDYYLEPNKNYKATCQIDLSNLQGWTDRVWVKATGRYYRRNKDGSGFILEAERRILSLVGAREISPWGNAIFAGAGQHGMVINGNVDIRGSVHILASSLGSNDMAMDLSGTGDIKNTYAGIPSDLGLRMPSIEKPYGAEMLDSLETEVRIQHGKLALSGTAGVGEPDVPGNVVKERVEGVYITDAYGGNQGDKNVYSDNGKHNPYDLGPEFGIEFPLLTGPYGGYDNYLEDYLKPNALVISESDNDKLSQLQNIDPSSNFDYSNDKGQIKMENGLLTIRGKVVVEGNVNFNKLYDENGIMLDSTIEYQGKASLTSTGSVGINCNLITTSFSTYPTADILGVMAVDAITFNSAQTNVMGVFYAQNQIVSQKQTSVAGTFFSNYFNMGKNVPSIFQVPGTVYNLPPGMIGDRRIWTMRKMTWGEI